MSESLPCGNPRARDPQTYSSAHDWLPLLKYTSPLCRLPAIDALVALGDEAAGPAASIILFPSYTLLEKAAAHTVLVRLIRERQSAAAVEAVTMLARQGNEALVRIE